MSVKQQSLLGIGDDRETGLIIADQNFRSIRQNLRIGPAPIRANFTFKDEDSLDSIQVDATNGPVVVTLPGIGGNRRRRVIKTDASANTVTVHSNLLINGAADRVLVLQYDLIEVEPSTTTWFVTETNIAFWYAGISLAGPPTGPAGGDLMGTYPNPSLIDVFPGGTFTYASIQVDTKGRIVAAANGVPPTFPTSLPPSGPAGGDLAGTYPNPTLVALWAGGSFTNANITVDTKGRVTAASNGSAGGGGSGTVNAGAINQVAYYAANGTVVSGTPAVIVAPEGLNLFGGATLAGLRFQNNATGVTSTDGTILYHGVGGTDFRIWNYENGAVRIGTNNVEVAIFGQTTTSLVTQTVLGTTAADFNNPGVLFIKGLTKGIRFQTLSTGVAMEGVDNTGVASYQPLALGGSLVYLQSSGVNRAIVAANEFQIVQTSRTSGSFPSSIYSDAGGTATNVNGGLIRHTGGGDGSWYVQYNTAPAGDFSGVGTIYRYWPNYFSVTGNIIASTAVSASGGPQLVTTGILMYGGGSTNPAYLYDSGTNGLNIRFGPSSAYNYAAFNGGMINFYTNFSVGGTLGVSGLATFGNDILLQRAGTNYLYYNSDLVIALNGTGPAISIDTSRNITMPGSLTAGGGVYAAGIVRVTDGTRQLSMVVSGATCYFGTQTNDNVVLIRNGGQVGVITASGLDSMSIGQIDPAAGRFTNLIATGTTTFGPGGAGTSPSIFAFDGGSGAAGGPYLAFRRGGSNCGYLGTASALFGGASSDLFLASATGGGLGIWSAGITIASFTTAGVAIAGAITATGNITAYYSDDRLKTRFGTIPNALEKVRRLEGFYYEANDLAQSMGYKPVREVGLSAQRMQEVLPEVVVPAPINDQYLTIHYERVIPLLVEALKELDAKFNAYKLAHP